MLPFLRTTLTLAPDSIDAFTESLLDPVVPVTMFCLPLYVTLSLALTLAPTSIGASTESQLDDMVPVTMHCFLIM